MTALISGCMDLDLKQKETSSELQEVLLKELQDNTIEQITTRILSEKEEELTIQYSFQKPNTQKVRIGSDSFNSINLDGCFSNAGIPGYPNIPICPSGNIVIPQDKELKSIEVTCSGTKSINGVSLDPVQQPTPILPEEELNELGFSTEPTIRDETIYSRSEKFPSKYNSDADVQTKKGYKLINLNLYPVSFYPTKKRIDYCESMIIKINLIDSKKPPVFENN